MPTLDQLEAFVSSPHYDAQTADLIARAIPALKAAGQPGELISPGVRRIHGNLCNVHGRYGPCDKALSGKKPKKGRAPAKPKKTDQQRAAERDTKRQANIDSVAKRMADSDTGLSPSGSKALTAFAKGQQPDKVQGDGLVTMGLAERASDGSSYRMTPTGRAVVSAMAAGDYQRAIDGISRATDQSGKRAERQTAAQARRATAAKRQQDAAGKRAAAQVARGLAKRQPTKASAGGRKKPATPAAEKPLRATPAKRVARSAAPSTGGAAGASANKKPQKPAPAPAPKPKPEKAPAKQIAPALADAATALSQGDDVADAQLQALIRNGLVKLNKDGDPVLTAAGQRATMKSTDGALLVFKDATGAYRWVAQSSTAFQDRDREIVSTKALSDDCAYADAHGSYGPLRWWHTPGLDLGDCDFNAMHGRVLIESGTFRSPAIAHKVAAAAAGLEISLGFLHLPSEPDADGVFHHIRRFERSLVPRGKASNRFTAFTVKESLPMDETKKAYLRDTLKFSDTDIAEIEARATATEKAADDARTAFKAEEPADLPDVIINGVTYKAFKPIEEDAAAPVEEDKAMPGNAAEDALDGGADDAMEEPDADPNALTLSQGDLDAINGMIVSAVGQIMGGLELDKKVAGHVQTLMAPYQQQQATKEAALTTQVAELQQQLKELTGDQPAAPYRASAAKDATLKAEADLLAAVRQQSSSSPYGDFDDIVRGLGLAPRP
jgi:hypothetical protein